MVLVLDLEEDDDYMMRTKWCRRRTRCTLLVVAVMICHHFHELIIFSSA